MDCPEGLRLEIPREVAFFIFKPGQARGILEGLGYRIRGDRILDSSGKQTHFFCCNRVASVKQLGRVMPGSIDLICDDPLCFNRYAVASVSE